MAGTSLKDLRDLNIVLVHPPDRDGTSLVDHLRRIGCRVDPRWPVPNELPDAVDILIVAIDRDFHPQITKLINRMGEPRPGIIAVVNYENPATLQLVLEMDALAVIGTPVRAFGLLTNLAICRNLLLEHRATDLKIRKLEAKLSGQKKTAKAKSILMEAHQLSEKEAYESLRAQAMAKRISLEQMAEAIINANELLNYKKKHD